MSMDSDNNWLGRDKWKLFMTSEDRADNAEFGDILRPFISLQQKTLLSFLKNVCTQSPCGASEVWVDKKDILYYIFFQ
jgi:hypothetical protein